MALLLAATLVACGGDDAPATGAVSSVALPHRAVSLMVGLDAVWVIGFEGTSIRIEAATRSDAASANVGQKGDRVLLEEW